MADPKYENLPGIAYDQPDVYETGDLPEADQPEPYEEEENESIENLHLSVKESFNKFKGKAGEWELAAEGTPETVLERYNRLRCEFSELLEQVTEQQNISTESEKAAGVRDEEAFRRLQASTGQAALVRGGELTAAEARVGALLANVEALKQAVRPVEPELDAKVNELHKLNFGKSLTELETLQSTISSGVQNNKELLQGVQEIFAMNVDSVQKEIKKLDERIGKLVA
ncbi:Dynactin [Operophtera brumata]|uniref:Dynactin n=1 Tax=Operophtera brumata TaxID=104452 RepID=A0A0L7LSS9_OPEBR|nr:Dynactin [Operophtera brumata]